MLNGTIVVNGIDELNRELRKQHGQPVTFTNNGQGCIRIWPSALSKLGGNPVNHQDSQTKNVA